MVMLLKQESAWKVVSKVRCKGRGKRESEKERVRTDKDRVVGGGVGERETPKRTPVEIRLGTRPTPTRVAAAPHSNNGSKRKRQGKREESLNALLILSGHVCVPAYECVWHTNAYTERQAK